VLYAILWQSDEETRTSLLLIKPRCFVEKVCADEVIDTSFRMGTFRKCRLSRGTSAFGTKAGLVNSVIGTAVMLLLVRRMAGYGASAVEGKADLAQTWARPFPKPMPSATSDPEHIVHPVAAQLRFRSIKGWCGD